MDGTVSELCPITGFLSIGAEILGSAVAAVVQPLRSCNASAGFLPNSLCFVSGLIHFKSGIQYLY